MLEHAPRMIGGRAKVKPGLPCEPRMARPICPHGALHPACPCRHARRLRRAGADRCPASRRAPGGAIIRRGAAPEEVLRAEAHAVKRDERGILLAEAHSLPASRLVLGAVPQSGIARLIFGSAMARLARGLKCLSGPGRFRSGIRWRRMMEISASGGASAMLQQMRERQAARAAQDRDGAFPSQPGQSLPATPAASATLRPAAPFRVSEAMLTALLGRQEDRSQDRPEVLRRQEAGHPLREALSAYGRAGGAGFGTREHGLGPR